MFFAKQSDGDPGVTSTWTGVILPGEESVILERGGTLSELGRIFPYRIP